MLLSLDLGMHCGWALFACGRRLASGTWHLGKGPRARCDEFLRQLLSVVQAQQVRTIVHEHVPSLHQHAGVDAAHLFGGWLEIIEIVRVRTGAQVVRVMTPEVHAAAGVVKQRAPKGLSESEKRKASAARRLDLKQQVVAAARARGWPVLDDNEADACFVGVVALTKGTGG